jgi:two-component system, cell cycle sensor histidine kinase DivJ
VRGRRDCDRAAVLLRNFVEFDPIRSYIDALVHPSVRGDALASARHRTFIGVRLLAGLIVFAAIPIYFAAAGAPGLLETALFAGLISPLLVVWYLSRTGNLERAHLISTGLLGALIALISGASGGVMSFAAPWLAVLPLEAALSASRRVILASLAVALAIAFGLWGAAALEWLPQPSTPASPATHFLALLSAALYVGAIALGMGAFARSGDRVKRAGEARYHLLARHMSDVITRHGRNGVVTFISPAAERLVGAPAAALMGHSLFERVHVADRPNFLAALIEASRGHTTSVEYRLRHGPLNGICQEAREAFIWVESRCHALEGAPESGEVVAVTRDVSRRKLDAEALEAARSEAERANEAKSRFLATVSHELRTPLNAIIGFSEMLTNETSHGLDAVRRADYARVICDSGQHLLAVVNGILDVSRIEAGHFELNPEAFAVAPLVESCYEMMLLRAEQAGLRFDVELARDLPEAVADQLALRQVLINLIANAIKFTPRGGNVSLAVKTVGSELLLSVSDTGIGIAESDLALVGQPFFQARSSYDRPYEGTGLGLSVVKGLVEMHGGRLEITSRVGEGTRALVRLPRVCNAASAAPKAVAPRSAARTTGFELEKVKRRA